jgi:hypothetical protein
MNTTARPDTTDAQLLRAAFELLGSNKLLSERLDVAQSLLIRYMTGLSDVPTDVVLRTVDLLIELRREKPDGRSLSA